MMHVALFSIFHVKCNTKKYVWKFNTAHSRQKYRQILHLICCFTALNKVLTVPRGYHINQILKKGILIEFSMSRSLRINLFMGHCCFYLHNNFFAATKRILCCYDIKSWHVQRSKYALLLKTFLYCKSHLKDTNST